MSLFRAGRRPDVRLVRVLFAILFAVSVVAGLVALAHHVLVGLAALVFGPVAVWIAGDQILFALRLGDTVLALRESMDLDI